MRIRTKLDTDDLSQKANPEEVHRSVGKMINSLDKLIYDSNYFGKNIPEINQLTEVKRMLKDVGSVNEHPDIERIKYAIDGILYTKRAMLRRSLGE
ncbi:MAG TPA: hypothetical protein VGK23_10070 [Methanomassiliicoccales archaeon]